MTVWSRIAPSRWRWSSTLGSERRSMARSLSVRGRAGAVGGARGRRRTSTRAVSIRSESREGRMLLEGKRLLITGVLTRDSIAYSVAEAAQEQGAELVLTSFGRAMSLTEKSAKRLPQPVDVLEMDANNPDHIQAVADDLAKRWGRVDGFLHAIAFAPRDALGGNFLNTPWESVQTALQTSAYSLKAIAVGMLPLMTEHGGGVVGLDFDASPVLSHQRQHPHGRSEETRAIPRRWRRPRCSCCRTGPPGSPGRSSTRTAGITR